MNATALTKTNDNCSHSSGDTNSNNNRDPGAYFLELARLGAARVAHGDAMEKHHEDAPTELNAINSSGGFMVVSRDKLAVKYIGVNLLGHKIGVVKANKPVPVKRLVYYFEIYVNNSGAKGQVAAREFESQERNT